MDEFLLGMEAAIYYGDAGDDLASLTELDNTTDVTLNMSKGEADVTTRANNGWRAIVGTLKEAGVDFTMIWRPGDAGFDALRDSFLNNTLVELAVLDNDRTVTGTSGPKGSWSVTNFSRNEPLEEAITVTVTVKLSVFDSWVEV